MEDFIRYFIEEMNKEAIEMPCAVIVNILKNVPGVPGVDEAVSIGSRYLIFLPDRLKTKEMCNEAVRNNPYTVEYVPDQYRTQEMCNEAVEVDPWLLKYVPDHFKIQKMRDKVVRDGAPISLDHVPDWFITKQRLKIMGDHCNNIWFIER